MNLRTNLKSWQEEAVEKLSKLKVGALYMDMGTGKTRTALELIDKREKEGKINKVVWLCPCSVVKTLENELTKHCRNWRYLIEICGIEILSSSIRANIKLCKITSSMTYLIADEKIQAHFKRHPSVQK